MKERAVIVGVEMEDGMGLAPVKQCICRGQYWRDKGSCLGTGHEALEEELALFVFRDNSVSTLCCSYFPQGTTMIL
jgi:hypothetical protein